MTDRPYLGPRRPRTVAHYIRRNAAKAARRAQVKPAKPEAPTTTD